MTNTKSGSDDEEHQRPPQLAHRMHIDFANSITLGRSKERFEFRQREILLLSAPSLLTWNLFYFESLYFMKI